MQKSTIVHTGRHQNISVAELASVYREAPKVLHDSFVEIDADVDIDRLGGSIRTARRLEKPIQSLTASDLFESDLQGKHTVGVSFFVRARSLQKESEQQVRTLLKALNSQIEGSLRTVPLHSKKALNSASIIHNKLTKPKGCELLIIEASNGKLIIAKTLQTQHLKNYERRDQQRPMRDGKVGMLPPKLAQILVNLTAGGTATNKTHIHDPFCGTGVVPQEALLIGCSASGSDLSERMVEYTNKNISWLLDQRMAQGVNQQAWTEAYQSNATAVKLPEGTSGIASEIFLGEALHDFASPEKIKNLEHEASKLVADTLSNLHNQLTDGSRVVLAVPAWRYKNCTAITTLTVVDQLRDLGYTPFSFLSSEPLLYFRDDQFVARHIVAIEVNKDRNE